MASTEKSFTHTGGSFAVTSLGAVVSAYDYEYDSLNRLSKLTCAVSSSQWETVYTYDGDGRPLTTTLNNGKIVTNTYDAIGRLTQKRIGLTSNYDTSLTYLAGANGSQTALLATYRNGSDSAYSYTYDENGNILTITQGTAITYYQYDAANQLKRHAESVMDLYLRFMGQPVEQEALRLCRKWRHARFMSANHNLFLWKRCMAGSVDKL